MPLRVAHLTKRYGHLTALAEVSFSIRPGEVLGLIGPNGSGKTTLFECLGGVLPSDSGTVFDGEVPLTARELKTRVFYLPDAIAPWPMQTVRWALGFIAGFFHRGQTIADSGTRIADSGTRIADSGMRIADPDIDAVVRELDLTPLLKLPIGTLSKGQRKRALLAMGLLTPHPVLLADEPFDGLDLRQMREVASTLRAHAATGRTMFLSIHQIGDAARVCDRFVLLSGGRVCGEGTLDELTGVAEARGGAPAADLEQVFLALT